MRETMTEKEEKLMQGRGEFCLIDDTAAKSMFVAEDDGRTRTSKKAQKFTTVKAAADYAKCHGISKYRVVMFVKENPMSKEIKETPIEESALPFGGGVIMPHVVSPEITGGEVATPRIVPKILPNVGHKGGETDEQ